MRLRETPVPIPNTMVKTQAADGTALETVWESRWLPELQKNILPLDTSIYLDGGVAQLGEHLPCKQGVKSSNLSISIWLKKFNHLMKFVPWKSHMENTKYQMVQSKDCNHADRDIRGSYL